MRHALSKFSLLCLAGCGAGSGAEPAISELRARQEAACVAAIAVHIRQPETVLTSRFLSETNGIAIVETLDNGRRHLCNVSADARVIEYSHPRG